MTTLEGFKIIESKDGYNRIEPTIMTVQQLIDRPDMHNRILYFKECKLGDDNAMEIHIICDKSVKRNESKQFDGLMNTFTKFPVPVVGGIR